MSLKELIARAEAVRPEGVKELVRDSHRMDNVYKRRVYGAIAHRTGMTIHEVWVLDTEVRLEKRHGKQ